MASHGDEPKKRLLIGCAMLAAPVVVLLLYSIGWIVLYSLGLVEFRYPVGG